jgi:hypothetical protein
VLVSGQCFEAGDPVGERRRRGALKRRIQRRIDSVSAPEHVEAEPRRLLPHRVDEVVRWGRHPGVRGDDDAFALRGVRGRRRHEPLLSHEAEDQIATLARPIGIDARIVVDRRLGEGGKQRRLSEGQTGSALAEIVARRRFDPVPPVAEVDRIEVGLEDLLLAVAPLHLACRLLLAQLATQAQVTAVDQLGVHVADELLRDRARSTAPLTEQFPLHGRCDADDVDAVVLVEALILDGDERRPDVLRQCPDRHARAPLAPGLTDERAVTAEDEGRLRERNDAPRLGAVAVPVLRSLLSRLLRWGRRDDAGMQRQSEREGSTEARERRERP